MCKVERIPLDHEGHHVIDEPVLVPEFLRLELWFVRGVIQSLEDVLEAPVILLQDGVFRREEQWVVSFQRILEARVTEGFNRLDIW